MTSEGLGEMFEGDFADTCAEKFPLVSMGAELRVNHAQTRERGPPSAPVEIYSLQCNFVLPSFLLFIPWDLCFIYVTSFLRNCPNILMLHVTCKEIFLELMLV